MNKIIIPAILAATVLFAGMYAFAPTERANAFHISVLDAAGALVVRTVENQNVNADIVLLADSADLKVGTICINHTDNPDNDALFIVADLDPTDGDAEAIVATNGQIEGATFCAPFAGYNLKFDQAGSDGTDLADYSVAYREQT